MAEQENDIKEGFICPICHKDLRSPKILISHFQDEHSDEQDILKSLKELVGKAKSKILKVDDRDLESFKSEMKFEKLILEPSLSQDMGASRSHIQYFKEVRRQRLDHRTTETNKLIIRLDKLLRVEGPDRRQMEQDLVTWLDGECVTRCPSCAVSFNLARRQHHCRLCGSIMCNNCSSFLTYENARSLVAPIHLDVTNVVPKPQKDDLETLRICFYCKGMLDSRRNVQTTFTDQPIVKLYNYLRKIKCETQPNIDLYNKMYMKLTYGDSSYQLQDAQALRVVLAKQAGILDDVSKKITEIPLDPDNPKAYGLQNAVRRATSVYINDQLLSLPILPTPVELDRIKQERLSKTIRDNHQVAATSIKTVAVTTGWSPVPDSRGSAERITNTEVFDDPLLEQMNIVRNYIEQAREASRFEEVAALRENLAMLKETYKKQQKAVKR